MRQLLEFTRAEKLSPRRIDPLRLVEDTLGQHRPALERHRIVVTIEDTRRAKRPLGKTISVLIARFDKLGHSVAI